MMTWGEFKDAVARLGVEDDHQVEWMDILSPSEERPVEVDFVDREAGKSVRIFC